MQVHIGVNVGSYGSRNATARTQSGAGSPTSVPDPAGTLHGRNRTTFFTPRAPPCPLEDPVP